MELDAGEERRGHDERGVDGDDEPSGPARSPGSQARVAVMRTNGRRAKAEEQVAY
jgi:hypothetical protein